MDSPASSSRSRFPRATPARVAGCLLAVLALAPAIVAAQTGSTSTTSTTLDPNVTTTLYVPTDVTGGGRFEGAFPKGSFDMYSFELTESRVMVAETTNGFGGCPGDTLLELRQAGVDGSCGGVYGDDQPCLAFDDDSGLSLCSRIVRRVLGPGSYWLRVSAYGGAALRRYFLEVEFVPFECGNGQVETSEQCDDGNTAGGDCCSADCYFEAGGSPCSDGVFCNGGDTCDATGACSVHEGDPCDGLDADGDCSETCDEQAGACSAGDPDGATCDDGVFCNGDDACSAGQCGVHAGDPCDGPDDDADCTESCDEGADSCGGADPEGAACDDGAFCNGVDTCSSGQCSQHEGDPCTGADGDLDCAESCNEATDACTGADPDGSACDDGLGCNGVDNCLGGACAGHVGDTCPGVDGDANCAESCSDSGGGCTNPDPEGAACDDGVFCNGPDRCSGGSCSVHLGNPCAGPDGDGNCSESCNEAADTCAGADPDGSACDDRAFCNGADTCKSGACSAHAGNPCPGADGDANCAESCSEVADTCTKPDANGSPCNDGEACTGSDQCASGICAGAAIPGCGEFLCGDVNGDGAVKASDALAILRAAVGDDSCSAKPCLCDANGNGSLSASDALVILRVAVGSPAATACPC